MVIVRLMGGLGNQLFQYAAARRLSIHTKQQLWLDLSHYNNDNIRKFELQYFNIQARIANQTQFETFKRHFAQQTFWHRILKRTYTIIEENPSQNDAEQVLQATGNTYLIGYWQSEAFFHDIKKTIHNDFQLKNPVEQSNAVVQQIQNATNAVCVHIRRGDYVSNQVAAKVLGVLPIEYYYRAEQLLIQQCTNISLFVFSDDVAWCQSNLKFKSPATFVADNTAIEHFHYMLHCKHYIIANSSFSWWAAWLNKDENKLIVAPNRWFNDTSFDSSYIIPHNWTKI